MLPKVVRVVPIEDYNVYVYFEDGKIVLYDVNPLLSKEVFKPLSDIRIFMNSCTIMNDTLAWDIGNNRNVTACIDIDPYTLYELPMTKEAI